MPFPSNVILDGATVRVSRSCAQYRPGVSFTRHAPSMDLQGVIHAFIRSFTRRVVLALRSGRRRSSSCDARGHACHTTPARFPKTAEDSLAHVTTASRLTCYHGDKPANENSADGCDVDGKLFCFKGVTYFFSPLPPEHQHPQPPATQTHYTRTCTHAFTF